jgi:hypothetical protein
MGKRPAKPYPPRAGTGRAAESATYGMLAKPPFAPASSEWQLDEQAHKVDDGLTQASG